VPPRCQQRALHEYWRDVEESADADAWSANNIAAHGSEKAAA
jgi:hypothetical protein